MTFDEVRVIRGDVTSLPEYRPERSAQQKHTDQALTNATNAAADALENATEALDWLTSVGASVPVALKGLPTLLTQLGGFIADEKVRRG